MAGLLSPIANIVSPVSQAVGGALGYNSSSPNLSVVPLDTGTQNIIGKQISQATQSPDQTVAQLNQGVSGAGTSALQNEAQGTQEAARSGQSPGMLQAIRNQYSGLAGQNIRNTLDQGKYNAIAQQAQWQQQAARSMLAQQQVETQNYTMLSQAMMQAEAARAQALSSILGAAGTIGGYAMAKGNKKETQKPYTVELPAMNEGNYGNIA